MLNYLNRVNYGNLNIWCKKINNCISSKIISTVFFVLFFLFFSPIMASAATITSTEVGGDWESSVTWIGGVVPLETDDVVIDGDVKLLTSQYSTHVKIVDSIKVTSNGNLETTNLSFRPVDLEISKNLKNDGIIHENVHVYLGEDLENNGII
ncbi:MAG: hypothetical protein KAI16_00140, partial [Candidatus Pacebacteria bacterium]|nr:hypothetical protein [Candidatus Paceibacterota bacterium]